MLEGIKNIINLFRDEMTTGELRGLTRRSRFSKFLPYSTYDPETKAFFNRDNTIGFLWECTPMVCANQQVFEILESLIKSGFPENSVLQFILYADPYITPYLDAYRNLKVRDSELSARTTHATVDFFQEGTKGLEAMQGTPVRNFRLFVALKMPLKTKNVAFMDIRDSVTESLKGVYLSPRLVSPAILINTLSKVFNDQIPDNVGYDEDQPINKQIITAETEIRDEWDKLRVGKKVLRCQTVKKMADFVDPLTWNYLAGDLWGVQGDANQITTPFLLAVNLCFQDIGAMLHRKCNLVLQQQAVGSFAPSLIRKQSEYLWATGEIEKGTKFVRIMPILWHFSDSDEESRENAARIKRIWQSRGFVPQHDRGILKILMLAALPFGLYTDEGAVDYIERDFIVQPSVAAKSLPVQVDFTGGGAPYCLFTGRKGQIVSFDLFSENSNNYNAFIAATSGSGKSFLTNSICYNYYTTGSIVRIIDIGGSYRKLCDIVGGRFINFAPNSGICLNPFTNIRNIDEEIGAIGAIVAQMIFSSSKKVPEETEMTLIKAAIKAVYDSYGNEGDIDKVYAYLSEPTKSLDVLAQLECGDDNHCIADIKTSSAKLAFNLANFTSSGHYGRWFNGPANLDIAHDDFCVLELEELKNQEELFNVVTLQILNYVTANLYLSDRSQRRLIIFDEAWQFFKNDSDILATMIMEGYRRARKYHGSFTCISQSTLDIDAWGNVGQVIMSNSAYKFYLQSSDFEKANNRKVIDYGPFMMRLLKSVRSPKPRYSEIWMDTPVGVGVARLIVDPFTYFLYTSDARENAEIDALVKEGYTFAKAFEIMMHRKNERQKAA